MNPNSTTPESPYMLAAGNDYYEYKNWRIVWSPGVRGVWIEHVKCDHAINADYGIHSCGACGAALSRDTWEHLRRAQKFLQAPPPTSG